MKIRSWFKDVLLVSLGLSGLVALAAFLLSSDRIQQPGTFHFESAQQKDIQQTAAAIDQSFESIWQQNNIQPAATADDNTVARRLSLALAGTLPSLEELRELEKVAPEKRTHWYVSRLLEDNRTSGYLGERFARAFVGIDEGPFLVYRRRKFVSWLSQQIESNTPYNRIANRLLTENGLWTDSPAVNFYTHNILPCEEDTKPDAIKLAARTSRAFLGMRIDCLQCHDDFLGTMNLGEADDPVEGTQLHFHSLAAFFSQVENSITGIRDNFDSSPYEYQLLDDDNEEVIEPEFPFNRNLDSHDDNLRVRLADWTTSPDNRPFSRAIINRVWAIMLGKPLIEPVDDIPLEGPFPEAMELLVDDFVENQFNLHRLIRVIAATRVFHLDSKANFEIASKHDRHWAVYPLVRLRPEQVAGSIAQSTSLSTIDSTAHIFKRLINYGQHVEFIRRYGDSGENEFGDRSETVAQRLLMLNGEMVSDGITTGLNSPVRIAGLSPDIDKAVETVYLSVLSRKPTEEERVYFVTQMENLSGDERTQKVVDLYWTLINSIEFVWSH